MLKILINKLDEKNIYVIDLNDNVLESAKKIGNVNLINIKENSDFIKDYKNQNFL